MGGLAVLIRMESIFLLETLKDILEFLIYQQVMLKILSHCMMLN